MICFGRALEQLVGSVISRCFVLHSLKGTTGLPLIGGDKRENHAWDLGSGCIPRLKNQTNGGQMAPGVFLRFSIRGTTNDDMFLGVETLGV